VDERSVARGVRPRLVRPPKARPCAGCGARFAERELVELHEGNHDGLTYFDGDLLCGECAGGAGVIR
jgi:hypothetical protein